MNAVRQAAGITHKTGYTTQWKLGGKLCLSGVTGPLSRSVSPPPTLVSDELALLLLAQMVALALLLLVPALTLPSVAHRPQLARHPQLQLLASASPKEEITPTAGLSVGAPHRSH